jgi:hypothetical protein
VSVRNLFCSLLILLVWHPNCGLALTIHIGDDAVEGDLVTDLGLVDSANSGDITYFFTTNSHTNNSGAAVNLTVTGVNFWADAGGTVTPFVALYDGGSNASASSYSILLKGDPIPADPGQLNNAGFTSAGGNPDITLAPGQTVVAGFHQTTGIVPFGGGGDGDFIQTGNVLPGSFPNPPIADANWSTLGRTYAFNITLEEAEAPLPPTEIALDNISLLLSTPIGTMVGTFATTDPNSNDSIFEYTLVSGPGSTDNSLFRIAGPRLETAAALGGPGASHIIRVRSTDPAGLAIERNFTITIIAGQAPTAITLSSAVAVTDLPPGGTVAKLITSDPDPNDHHRYQLVEGAGAADNAAFAIVGDELRTTRPFPADGGTLSVRIRSTDLGEYSFEQSFTISVIAPSVRISEFMASNSSTLLDEDGESSDWIEIFNERGEELNLAGWYLTDDVTDLTKWRFPSRVVAGGDYLIVFASNKNRTGADDSELHTDFKLASIGEYLALVRPDGQTIASEFSPTYPPQTTDVSYGTSQDSTVTGFLSSPSPGSANETPSPVGVSAAKFSVERGFFDSAFEVTLTPTIPGSTIRYTTNGSKPTMSSGTIYSSPIDVSGTTTLRAIAYHPGGPEPVINTHTYVFVDDVVNQGAMSTAITSHPVWGPQMEESLLEIPTVSLVKSGSVSQTESETSMELIFPDGTAGFQIDCGVEHFGGHSLNSPKKNMRMSFKKAYGPSRLNYDLFGGEAAMDFNQIILRTGSHDNWFWTHPSGHGGVYVRGRWAFDRQLESGNVAPRGRWVHVYINGTYHGMHHMMERPNAAFMASYLGGDETDYEALNAGTPIDGDKSTWNAMKAVLGDYEELQNHMDVKNYADYMLLQFYGGNDWDWNTSQNWASASRKVPDASYKFFAWDSDVIMRTTLNANVINRGGPENLWTTIKTHDEFRLLLADRAQKFFFNEGMLTRDRVLSQIDDLTAVIEKSVIAETARWGNGTWTPATWQGHINSMKDDLIDRRTEVVVAQMRSAGVFPDFDAPIFSQRGGNVAADFQLTLSLPANAVAGQIIYTTDGSDPIADAPPPGSTETILLDQGAAARAFIPSIANGGSSLGDSWKGGSEPFDDSSWLVGTTGLGFDVGTDYRPLIGLDLQAMQSVNGSAFARVAFTLTAEQLDDLDRLRLDMKSEDGFVAYLNGVKIASLQSPENLEWDSVAVGATNDSIATQFQPYDLTQTIGDLVVGTNILAIQLLNQSSGSSDLLCLPRLVGTKFPDGAGGNPGGQLYTGPISLSRSGTVRARTKVGSEWSALDEAFFYVEASPPSPGELVVSEMNYNPTGTENAEFIELANTSAKNLTLDGLQFVDGISFTFPPNTVLEVGERIVVVADEVIFASRYIDPSSPWQNGPVVVAGVFSGSLNNGGETLRLQDRNGTDLLNFAYNDSGSWPGRADAKGSSLELEDVNAAPTTQPALDSYLEGGSRWRPSSEFHGSPGRAGNGPDNRIVFNEVLAHTAPPAVDRFELYNQTGTAVDLGRWFISDDRDEFKKFEITSGTSLAPGAFLTFDEADFNSGTSLIDFALNSSSGDDLYLLSADGSGNLLAFVDHAEFGASADGESFGRWPDGGRGFYPMQAQTFGQPNHIGGNSIRVGPVVVSEVMYHPGNDPDDGFEFIEICNSGISSESLAHWRLRGEADFDFEPETLEAGAVLVIVGFDAASDTASRDAFLAAYPTASASQLRGPWSAGLMNLLDNSDASVRLQRPDALVIPQTGEPFYPALFEDRVTYGNTAPWPTGADGGGSSLSRISAEIYGDHAGNWQALSPTPGNHPANGGISYESWAATNSLGDGPLSEPLADFDSDGTNNFIEFALASDPTLPDVEKLPTGTVRVVEVFGATDNYQTITFRKRQDAPQLNYLVEISDGLASWTQVANIVGPPKDNGDGTDSVTVRDEQPIGANSKRFMRLRIIGN